METPICDPGAGRARLYINIDLREVCWTTRGRLFIQRPRRAWKSPRQTPFIFPCLTPIKLRHRSCLRVEHSSLYDYCRHRSGSLGYLHPINTARVPLVSRSCPLLRCISLLVMTEYDYSPEAYERYLSTQNRVSNWVHDQAVYSRQYQNAFVPRSVSTPPSEDTYRPSSSHRESSSHHTSSHQAPGQPDPRRIYASPPHDVYAPSRQAVPISYIPPNAPPNATHKMYNYTYDPRTREVVLPPPRPGETYVIIPPNGKRIEIVVSSRLDLTRRKAEICCRRMAPPAPTPPRPGVAPEARQRKINLCSGDSSQA